MIVISKKDRSHFVSTWIFCSLMSTDYFLQVDGAILAAASSSHSQSCVLFLVLVLWGLLFSVCKSVPMATYEQGGFNKRQTRGPLVFSSHTVQTNTLSHIYDFTDTFSKLSLASLSVVSASPHCDKTPEVTANKRRKVWIHSFHSFKGFSPWSGPIVLGLWQSSIPCLLYL